MKRIRLVVITVIIIAAVSIGTWWGVKSFSSESSADISASGFIEAKDVSVAFEIGGRIVAIAVDEGDEVEEGMPLVALDDSLLKAQVREAEANVGLARANLEQAIVTENGTRKVWENALDVQNNPLELEAKIIAAQGEFDLAELNLERVTKESVPNWWDERNAELRHDIAEKALQNLLEIEANPQEINAAVDQAYTAYMTAIAAVAAAESQLERAEAALEISEVQLDKLALSSPISGVVAGKHFEVGEVVQAGASVLTVTELEQVTLTTYVPESKIGLVKLGQETLVTVDSYPEEIFNGRVVYISPQAVFTPKNIQLKEEREKTVFAIKIRLNNPEMKLKPGTPADAEIITGAGG